MKQFKTSIVAWMLVFSILSFVALVYVTTFDQMQEVSSALVLSMCFAVMLRWSPWAWRSVRSGREGFNFLIVAVFGLVASIAMQRIWINITRWLGRPDWLVLSPGGAFTAWLIATMLALIVLAPDTEKGVIPHENLIWLGSAMFIAGLSAGSAIVYLAFVI